MTHGDDLIEAIIEGRIDDTPGFTQALLDGGVAAREIMEKLMIPAMEAVGDKFESKEYFVPEVIVSAQAMKAALELIEPVLTESGEEPVGKVVIGTVKGDLHDIGKNVVAMMLQGAGLQVVNLGVDVEPDAFVKAVKEQGADILGMSSLLTTAMRNMTTTMEMLAEEGVRDNLKVMVGGAAITPSFAERIGADAYGDDANGAVRIAREWCK
jgi:5-methyltetrahydrofolate--homocysteine methyltransferase